MTTAITDIGSISVMRLGPNSAISGTESTPKVTVTIEPTVSSTKASQTCRHPSEKFPVTLPSRMKQWAW